MLGWFHALMPKEQRFFELFDRSLVGEVLVVAREIEEEMPGGAEPDAFEKLGASRTDAANEFDRRREATFDVVGRGGSRRRGGGIHAAILTRRLGGVDASFRARQACGRK